MNQITHSPKALDKFYQDSLESLFPESKINAFRMLSEDNRRLIQDIHHSSQTHKTTEGDYTDEN